MTNSSVNGLSIAVAANATRLPEAKISTRLRKRRRGVAAILHDALDVVDAESSIRRAPFAGRGLARAPSTHTV